MNGPMVNPDGAIADGVGGRALSIIVSGPDHEGLVEVSIPRGASVRLLIEAVATRSGRVAEEILLFIDEADEPLGPDTVIGDGHPHHRRHHAHHGHQVEVVVHYGAGSAEGRFSPAVRIERVLRWAIGRFPQIDAAMASELELKVGAGGPELPGSDNLGQHVHRGAHRIELELTRGVIANGAST